MGRRRAGTALGSIGEEAPHEQRLSQALLGDLSRGLKALTISNPGDDWETSSISDTFSQLCSVYNGRRVPLSVINSKLQMLHEDLGISMTKIKEVIREKNICLYNCKHHDSQAALRAALCIHNDWIVSREKVKQYKYCKICLIELTARKR